MAETSAGKGRLLEQTLATRVSEPLVAQYYLLYYLLVQYYLVYYVLVQCYLVCHTGCDGVLLSCYGSVVQSCYRR